MSILGWIIQALFLSWLTGTKRKKVAIEVERQNIADRGIVTLSRRNLQSFFDNTTHVTNCLITGANSRAGRRVDAVCSSAARANAGGLPVIILHEQNNYLESTLTKYLEPDKFITISRKNPVFEPFYGLRGKQISKLVLNSTNEDYPIGPQGRNYIEAIARLLQEKKADPTATRFISCPHSELATIINKEKQRGILDDKAESEINSMLMQGQQERPNIENYFYELNHQINGVIAKSNITNKRKYNIIKAANNKKVLLIDIQSRTNTLLLNMLAIQVRYVIENGTPLYLIIDNLSTIGCKALQNLLVLAPGNLTYLINTDDACAMFGDEKNNFDLVFENCRRYFIFSHSSGESCERIASAIGYYNRQETGGALKGDNVAVRREYIVRPEEINRLHDNEIYTYNHVDRKICHLQLN